VGHAKAAKLTRQIDDKKMPFVTLFIDGKPAILEGLAGFPQRKTIKESVKTTPTNWHHYLSITGVVMNEKTDIAKPAAGTMQVAGEFGSQVELALKKSAPLQRPFFVVLLQVEGLEQFKSRRSPEEVTRLLRDLHSAVRKAVHPSQYVGVFRNGLGLVFDAADPGQVDTISRRLMSLCQQTIRTGRYNDLTARWSDILLQFLSPAGNAVLVTKVGWAIYPRDGMTAADMIKRAWNSLIEQSR